MCHRSHNKCRWPGRISQWFGCVITVSLLLVSDMSYDGTAMLAGDELQRKKLMLLCFDGVAVGFVFVYFLICSVYG